MKSHQKIRLLCLSVKFGIIILLSASAILISREVFTQYASRDTSFKQSEVQVTEKESITLVVAFWPLKKMDYPTDVPYQAYEQLELGKDFTLRFGITEYRSAQESITLTENDNDLKISHSQIGKVRFKKLTAKWGYGYKISANLIHVKPPANAFITVEFNKDIPEEDLPNIDLYLSSEPNSYGYPMFKWLDGQNVLENKVRGFSLKEIRQNKIVKLESSSNCQKEPYYECFHTKLDIADYSQCPRKCFAISTPLNGQPICKTLEEFQCSWEIAKQVANDNSSTQCLPSCKQIDMSIVNQYQEDQDAPDARRNVTVRYVFATDKMKVEEEYLINDFVKMLGSIGGTLGMCIGFSFLGLASMVLQFFEKGMVRKSDLEIGSIQPKLFKVKKKNQVIDISPDAKEERSEIDIFAQQIMDRVTNKCQRKRARNERKFLTA